MNINSFEDEKNNVKVFVKKELKIDYGICYKITAPTKIENMYWNDGSFNYKKYMKSNRIWFEANATEIMGSKNNFLLKIKKIRKQLITRNCTINATICPYVNAMVLGSNDIDDYYSNLYGNVGIASLFVISGMHITLLYKFLLSVLSRLKVVNETAMKISISILCIYTIIAGASVGVIRAVLMLIFKVLFKMKLNRAILAAFVVTIFINPFNIFNKGYILSYIVTLSIIYLVEIIKINSFQDSVKLSFYIYLIAYPICYSFNYTLNFLAPIVICVIGPIIMYILIPLSFIVTIVPNKICSLLISGAIMTINNLSLLANNFTYVVGHINFLMWIIYGVIVLNVLKEKKIAKYELSLWFLLVCLDVTFFPKVTFIDVGQGDSALIEVGKYNVLIDAGKDENELINELHYQGVNNLNYVFVSHAHADHYGEIEMMGREIEINNIVELSNNQLFASSLEVSNAIGNKNIMIIPYYGTNENDRELIIKVTLKDVSFLFPGDVEAESEKYLVENYCQQINSDILKVPHHGSATSSSEQFLSCVSPRIAVISSGRNNRYNHPDEDVVANYNQITNVYNTQNDGEIQIKVKKNKIKLNTNKRNRHN